MSSKPPLNIKIPPFYARAHAATQPTQVIQLTQLTQMTQTSLEVHEVQ